MKNKTQELNQIDYYEIEDGTLSLLDILLFFAKHLKPIIIAPLISMVFVAFFSFFFIKPIYTSTSKIMSSSSAGRVSQVAGIAAQFGVNLTGDQSENKWPYVEILKSRTIAKSILNKRYVYDVDKNKKTLLNILTNKNEHVEDREKHLSAGIDLLIEKINISEDLLTGILTINTDASDPIIAKEINKALIEELDSFRRTYNKVKTSEAKIFIEERIVAVKNELVLAEEKLRTFRDRNRQIQNSPSLQLEVQRLSREVTVLIGVFTTLKQQLETTKIEEVKESDYVTILDAPELPFSPSKPNKKFLVIISGFFGLLIGILFSIFSEFLESNKKNNLKKVNELKKYFKFFF